MSDDEMHSDEEGDTGAPEEQALSEEEEESKAEDTGPTEAQLAMQKRRAAPISKAGLDDEQVQMLEENKEERARMEDEIKELKERSERRKRERFEEEKLLTKRRIEEDHRRKADEEERRVKKLEDEMSKKEERLKKMAEFEKWKNPQSPNFVIQKKDRPVAAATTDEEDNEPKISKEQLEAEKKAILAQRIQPLNTAGADAAKLAEKAKDLHNQLYRLESEKYDLEKRFKAQQVDMMDLAERARQMNKVGNQGSIKRVQLSEEDSDKIQERFAGCPAQIIMYSEYERTKDNRSFGNRRGLYVGPVYGYPADRIKPLRVIKWNDEGLPMYEEEEEGQEGQTIEAAE